MATRYKIAKTASPTFTGVVTIPTINLTGGQIAFPAAQSASADVNTLDDYEEGTWTPDLRFGASATGITYSYQTGWYTKVGNLVKASASFVLTNKGAQAGSAAIYGLPFVNKAGNYNRCAVCIGKLNAVTYANAPMAEVQENS